MFAKVASIVLNFIVLILNAVSLSYLYKLESIGCPCAESKYRKFLKGYMIFALIYLTASIILTGSLNPDKLSGSMGKFSPLVIAMALVNILFTIATVVFFVLAIRYVHRLVQEKCECSEDVRREILKYWSYIQLSLMGIIILLPLALTIILGAIGLLQSNFNGKKLMEYKKEADSIVINPVASIKKATKTIKDQAKRLTK